MCRGDQKKVYTVAEVAEHTSRDDALIIIEGKVYDAGRFLRNEMHPGGEVILTMAGRDATDAFRAYHPDSVARRKLPKYKVGVVDHVEVDEMTAEYRAMRIKMEDDGLYDVRKLYWVFKVLYPIAMVAVGLALFRAGFVSVIPYMIGGFLIGLAQHQWAFIGHDACHTSIFLDWGPDFILSIFCGTLGFGVSSAWWKYTHNQHHVVTNEYDRDPDITHLPFLAVHKQMFLSKKLGKPMKPLERRITRFLVGLQWFTFFPILLGVARISILVNCLLMQYGPRVPTMPWQPFHLPTSWKWADRLAALGHFAWQYWVFVHMAPPGYKIAAFLPNYFMVSFLHVQLTLSHFERPTKHSSEEEDNWFVKQVVTGRNIEGDIWNEWFLGGLHFQIEHHLYPRMPRHNLRRARDEYVLPFCKKWGIPYCSTNFWCTVADVWRQMETVSQHAQDELTE